MTDIIARAAQLAGVHTDNLAHWIAMLPADDRDAALTSIEMLYNADDGGYIDHAVAMRLIIRQITAAARSAARRESNRRTERPRRITVGCKIPLSLYDQCRAAAAARGISLNAWMREAVQDKLQPPHDPGGEDFNPFYGW